MTLYQLLATTTNTVLYEEEARNFLAAKSMRIASLDKLYIFKLAWRNGWRPRAI